MKLGAWICGLAVVLGVAAAYAQPPKPGDVKRKKGPPPPRFAPAAAREDGGTVAKSRDAASFAAQGDSSEAAIPWFATLTRGLDEAKRTGKPILFVSAAPHCAGVSGMW